MRYAWIAFHTVVISAAMGFGWSRGSELVLYPLDIQRELLGSTVTKGQPPTKFRRFIGYGEAAFVWEYDLGPEELTRLRGRCTAEKAHGHDDSCIIATNVARKRGARRTALLIGDKLQLRLSWH